MKFKTYIATAIIKDIRSVVQYLLFFSLKILVDIQSPNAFKNIINIKKIIVRIKPLKISKLVIIFNHKSLKTIDIFNILLKYKAISSYAL